MNKNIKYFFILVVIVVSLVPLYKLKTTIIKYNGQELLYKANIKTLKHKSDSLSICYNNARKNIIALQDSMNNNKLTIDSINVIKKNISIKLRNSQNVIRRMKNKLMNKKLDTVFKVLNIKYRIKSNDDRIVYKLNDVKSKNVLMLYSENNSNIKLIEKEVKINKLLNKQNIIIKKISDVDKIEIKKLKAECLFIDVGHEQEKIKLNRKYNTVKTQRNILAYSSCGLLLLLVLL